MARYNDGYECDKPAKQILDELITDVWFSAFTVTFDLDNNNDEYAPIDRIFTATSTTGKEYPYAIELKHRMGYKITDNNDDWMLEIKKYNDMQDYASSGYSTFYFNLFKDNDYYLWKFEDIKKYKTEGYKYSKPHTQGDDKEKYIRKKRYFIKGDKAIKKGHYDSNRLHNRK